MTFSQCDYPLKDFRDNIEKFFGSNLEKGVVSQEKHKDGGLHLHAAICLHQQVTSRDKGLFDRLVDPPHHPNIQGRFTGGDAESFRLCDEGGELLAAKREIIRLEGILEAKQREEELSSSTDRKRIRRSPSGRCDGEQQGLHAASRKASPRLRSLAARARERRLKFAKAQAQKVFVVPAPGYFNAWNNEIASWLTTNLRQKRKHRQKQLWIQGPGGIGKTTLVTMMEEIYSLSIYRWPKDERWWDLYGDGQYDLIVLDEFRSQKMITG